MTPSPINVLPGEYARRLEALVAANLNQTFPAACLMVIRRGEVLVHRAWGWLDPEAQLSTATPATLFDLASLTKLFVASAFLSLVSAGKARLDTPLVEIIPEFGEINPRPTDGGVDPHTKQALPIPDEMIGKRVDPTQVTLRHLLTHTSGLAAWRDVYNAAGLAPLPPDQLDPVARGERWARALAALCRYPFVTPPGALVRYSDLGLMLLGEAVSRLHGASLEAAVRERVTGPLGLTSVTYLPMQAGYDRSAIAPTEVDPTWRKRRCWGEVHDENACGVGGVAGHAGLFATAAEAAALGQAWLSRDPRLGIDGELMDMATQEQAETAGERRGLGWMMKSLKGSSAGDLTHPSTYGHTGFVGNSLFIDPTRDLVMATLANWVYFGRDRDGMIEFRRALHDLIAEAVDRA